MNVCILHEAALMNISSTSNPNETFLIQVKRTVTTKGTFDVLQPELIIYREGTKKSQMLSLIHEIRDNFGYHLINLVQIN